MQKSVCAVVTVMLFGCGGPSIQLRGDVPQIIRDSPEQVERIARFVEKQTHLTGPIDAVIHFVPYERTEELSPELVAIRRQVQELRPDDDSVCYHCVMFAMGMSYPGTPHLQIDPRLWADEKPGDENPLLPRWWRGGQYLLGHEMLHRALNIQGVPLKDQHCRMKSEGYSAALAQFIRAMQWTPDSVFETANAYEASHRCPQQE